MNLKKAFGIDQDENADSNSELEKLKAEKAKLEAQVGNTQIQIQKQKSSEPKSKKQEQQMPAIFSDTTKQILGNLYADNPRPFQATAQAYSKAIAESIIFQSEARNMKRLNFEDEMKGKIEFKGGSYALIYKGNTPVRLTPFIWQLDQGTRRSWAVFNFNNFYGHKEPSNFKFWKKIWTVLVLTPYDNSSEMVNSYGKGALAKFDENTQFQMPVANQDSKAMEIMRMLNKMFLSGGLTLWQDLAAFTKPKLNVRLILYLVIAAGIIIFIYYFLSTHPGFLSSIFGPNL